MSLPQFDGNNQSDISNEHGSLSYSYYDHPLSAPLLVESCCSEDDDSSWDSTDSEKAFTRKSYISSLLFLLGSIFYLAIDVRDVYCDFFDTVSQSSDDDDYDDDDDDDDDDAVFIFGNDFAINMEMIFGILASLSFLLNGIVDYKNAKSTRHTTLIDENEPVSNHAGVVVIDPSLKEEEEVELTDTLVRPKDNTSTTSFPAQHTRSSNKLLDREVTLEKAIALLLGIGALLDLIGSLFINAVPELSDSFSSAACHFYLLEAIVAVVGRKFVVDGETEFQCLEAAGDALFLIGSIIDVVISYLYFIPSISESVQLSLGSLFSSTLWLIDAIIYILLVLPPSHICQSTY